MKMPGELDPRYIAARRALLDALEALAEHRGDPEFVITACTALTEDLLLLLQ